jgi:hypothetical protein
VSVDPRASAGGKSGWRAPATVSIVLLLATAGYLLVRSRGDAAPDVGETEGSGGAAPSDPPPSAQPPSDVTRIVGIWRFDSITGVAPEDLPLDAVQDNRRDIVIQDDGAFRWGAWSGRVEGSDREYVLFVRRPARLSRRFDEYDAGVRVQLLDGMLRVWLPDLGQDRDVDRGEEVQEDIDSPDMTFRRVRRAVEEGS